MSDMVISEKIVGTHQVKGREVRVVRLEWRDAEGFSYDLWDSLTGKVLTMDESFDNYPTDEQMLIAVEQAADGEPGE